MALSFLIVPEIEWSRLNFELHNNRSMQNKHHGPIFNVQCNLYISTIYISGITVIISRVSLFIRASTPMDLRPISLPFPFIGLYCIDFEWLNNCQHSVEKVQST